MNQKDYVKMSFFERQQYNAQQFQLTLQVSKSYKQIELERQGHVFNGQELLDNHEIDEKKQCYCERALK